MLIICSHKFIIRKIIIILKIDREGEGGEILITNDDIMSA